MITPSFYWNVAHGTIPGDVSSDFEAISVLKNLANNMSWMLNIKDYSKNAFPLPDSEPRSITNFIR